MIFLFGNKKKFAIECSINQAKPHLLGQVRLWICGIYLGYFDEEVMLNNFLHSINNLNERLNNLNDITLKNKSISNLFDEIYNTHNDNGKYLFIPIESFDDFEIFILTQESEIHFFWQLIEEPFFKYDNYPSGKQHSTVDIIFLEIP